MGESVTSQHPHYWSCVEVFFFCRATGGLGWLAPTPVMVSLGLLCAMGAFRQLLVLRPPWGLPGSLFNTIQFGVRCVDSWWHGYVPEN